MSTREDVATEASRSETGSRTGAGFGRVGLANLVVTVSGFITGPVLAQTLGPTSRGVLASVVVPFNFVIDVSVGLQNYVTRATARGKSRAVLVGSLGVVAFALGVLAFGLAWVLSDAIAEGRDVVHDSLLIGFALMPVVLWIHALVGIAWGSESWNVYSLVRVTLPLVTLLLLLGLLIAGALTVKTAALATFAGTVATGLPLLRLLRSAGPPKVVMRVVREAVSFGSRASAASLAQVSNNRLDQLLMIPLAGVRELGLYVVAVNAASITNIVVFALAVAVGPRVARGDFALATQAVRITLATVVACNVLLAALLPFMLPLLFGRDFSAAVPMAMLLLVAAVSGAGSVVLGSGLINAGRPGVPAMAEGVAAVITVIGLVLLIPSLGGVGAALVSIVAYATSFWIQVWVARRVFGCRTSDILIPRPADRHAIKALWETIQTRFRGRAP